MDKFLTRKTAQDVKVDKLAEHLAAAAPDPVQHPRAAYSGKPWALWDDKQREAAALLFLEKGHKACILKYGEKSCPPPHNPSELERVHSQGWEDEQRGAPGYLEGGRDCQA